MNETLSHEQLCANINRLIEGTHDDRDAVWGNPILRSHEALRSSLARAEADLATEREVIATMHANMRKAEAALAAAKAECERLRLALYDGTPDCRHGCILVINRTKERDAALSAAAKMRGALAEIVALDDADPGCDGPVKVCGLASIARAALAHADGETHEARWARLGWHVEWTDKERQYAILPRGFSLSDDWTGRKHGVLPHAEFAPTVQAVDEWIAARAIGRGEKGE